jgi:hypothetical protein
MKGYVHDRTVRALVRRSEGNKLKSTILRQQLMSSDPLGKLPASEWPGEAAQLAQ